MKNIIILIFLAFFFTNAIAQRSPIKWGKVDKEHWQLQKVTYDSAADAVILCDFGKLSFGYGIPTTVRRHTRIKILNEKGLHWANVSLPYYSHKNIENITQVKAQTLNYEKGKIEKIKVDDIFENDISEKVKSKRFAFSDVKVGSILEYSYLKTITNELTLEDWEFQSELPTLHSEFQAKVSEGLDVRIVFTSRRLLNKFGSKSTNKWFLNNLPAIKDEPFCPNPDDYVERISFQLAGYYKRGSMGGSEYVNIMTTWDELGSELYSYGPVHTFISKKRNARELLEKCRPCNRTSITPVEKIQAIYNFTVSNFNYNNKRRMYPDQNFNDFIETRSGNSSELNLLLTTLLREADLDAFPAIISTKDHGIMREGYPLLDQFNKMVAAVEINGKTIVLDAINKNLPYDVLPKEDLNDKALVFKNNKAWWVDIPEPASKTKKNLYVNADYTGDTVKYAFSAIMTGYTAADYREKLFNNDIKEVLADNFITNKNIAIDSFSIQNIEERDKPLTISFYFTESNNEMKKNRMVYFEPMIFKKLLANPFSLPERELPIDFIHNSYFNTHFSILLPKEIKINEIPQSIKFLMPNKKADFVYQVNADESIVQMQIALNHYDHYFTAYEYPTLRQMYTLIEDKFAQPIVLKRK